MSIRNALTAHLQAFSRHVEQEPTLGRLYGFIYEDHGESYELVRIVKDAVETYGDKSQFDNQPIVGSSPVIVLAPRTLPSLSRVEVQMLVVIGARRLEADVVCRKIGFRNEIYVKQLLRRLVRLDVLDFEDGKFAVNSWVKPLLATMA